MKTHITKVPLTSQLKEHIYKQFSKHAIASKGFDGLANDPICFEIRDNEKLIGACVVQLFWGQLHIKYLFVDEKYRGLGFARQLMEQAFLYGRDQGCNFSFVETMSFQAPEFYQKFGFTIELKRDGYEGGTSFYYMKRDY